MTDGTSEAVIVALTRLETKLDLYTQQAADRIQTEDDRHKDHESRLRKVERFMWRQLGAGAMAGGAAGSALAWVLTH